MQVNTLITQETMYDFSLGNPNVPAPAEVNEAVKDIVDNEESTFIHGYMSNAGYPITRKHLYESAIYVLL